MPRLSLVMMLDDLSAFCVPDERAVFDSRQEAQRFVEGFSMPPPAGTHWRLLAASDAVADDRRVAMDALTTRLVGRPTTVELLMEDADGTQRPAFSKERLLFGSPHLANSLVALHPPLLDGCRWVCVPTAPEPNAALEADIARDFTDADPPTITFTVFSRNPQQMARSIGRECPFPCVRTLWTSRWVEYECPWDGRLMALFRLVRMLGGRPVMDDIRLEE